jgi:hypothetical protein
MSDGDVLLPGWQCPGCLVFNGDAKERLEACRCCGGPRPKNTDEAFQMLAKTHATVLGNLRDTQARCSELLLSYRNLKEKLKPLMTELGPLIEAMPSGPAFLALVGVKK